MSDTALDLIVYAFVLVPAAATVANVYLWRKWLRSYDPLSGRRSWLLRMLAIAATIVNGSSLFFGFLAWRRISGAEALDWTPPFSAFAALALEVIPIYFALEFRRRDLRARRRQSDG